jgi:hypothetical protein
MKENSEKGAFKYNIFYILSELLQLSQCTPPPNTITKINSQKEKEVVELNLLQSSL